MKKLGTSLTILCIGALQGCGIGPIYPVKGYRPPPPAPLHTRVSDEYVCEFASDKGTKWSVSKNLSVWVEEAKHRNLTLDVCRRFTEQQKKSREELVEQQKIALDRKTCKLAVANNGEWESRDHRIRWVTEAKRRGFTPETCEQLVFPEESSRWICMSAIRNDEWAMENILFVNEAKRRGLTPAKCKFLYRP
jgi:hypothetical protein